MNILEQKQNENLTLEVYNTASSLKEIQIYLQEKKDGSLYAEAYLFQSRGSLLTAMNSFPWVMRISIPKDFPDCLDVELTSTTNRQSFETEIANFQKKQGWRGSVGEALVYAFHNYKQSPEYRQELHRIIYNWLSVFTAEVSPFKELCEKKRNK